MPNEQRHFSAALTENERFSFTFRSFQGEPGDAGNFLGTGSAG
jgi:hypothetical protein